LKQRLGRLPDVASGPTAAFLGLKLPRELRGTMATIILILAGLHASVSLIHHYLWQDGVLRRMLPGGN
jgi:cytochrome b561